MHYGCLKSDTYFNYSEKIIYTVFDEPYGGGIINEIIYNDYFYRVYKDKEPDPVNDTSKGIEDSTFWRMENVLNLLAMLKAFEQEEKVVVYDKNSPHWEEIADYYRLTMRNHTSWESNEEAPLVFLYIHNSMILIKDICNLT